MAAPQGAETSVASVGGWRERTWAALAATSVRSPAFRQRPQRTWGLAGLSNSSDAPPPLAAPVQSKRISALLSNDNGQGAWTVPFLLPPVASAVSSGGTALLDRHNDRQEQEGQAAAGGGDVPPQAPQVLQSETMRLQEPLIVPTTVRGSGSGVRGIIGSAGSPDAAAAGIEPPRERSRELRELASPPRASSRQRGGVLSPRSERRLRWGGLPPCEPPAPSSHRRPSASASISPASPLSPPRTPQSRRSGSALHAGGVSWAIDCVGVGVDDELSLEGTPPPMTLRNAPALHFAKGPRLWPSARNGERARTSHGARVRLLKGSVNGGGGGNNKGDRPFTAPTLLPPPAEMSIEPW